METLPLLKKELQDEYAITQKFIAEFPEGKNDYAPHPKSMKLLPLTTHIVEIFGWPEYIMKTEKIDFAAGDYKPTVLESKADMQHKLEENYRKSLETLENMTEEKLEGRWAMTMGEKVLMDFSKYEAIRHALNQITHHRAQLGIYYRLNDIALPPSYGPSADVENPY